MGRRGGARRAPRPPRRRRSTVAGVALALLAAGGFAGLALATTDDTGPTARPGSGSRSASGTPAAGRPASTPTAAAPQRVVRGVRFKHRILTLPEMRRKFGKQGLDLVQVDPTLPTTFTIASFNVLGSSHTGTRGDAAGPARAARAGSLVRRKGVSVVGLQEFQANQVGPFLAAAGMRAFPGSSLGSLAGENSIAWDAGVWELVEGHTHSIPYFGGKGREMPYVKLRHLGTGRVAWFSNYHNPADVHGNAQGYRVTATAREAALVRELTADGTPMFTTGDMNERDSYACRFSAAGMHSADGARTVDGSCRLPGDEWIDWIWGSSAVTFSGYVRDYGPRSDPKISDHPIITATATVAPLADGGACEKYTRHGTTYWFCPASS